MHRLRGAVVAKFTSDNARQMGARGGTTTVARRGTVHMRQIGKRGFASTVASHWNGDRDAYLDFLHERALMAIDPFPENGAWQPKPAQPRLPLIERVAYVLSENSCTPLYNSWDVPVGQWQSGYTLKAEDDAVSVKYVQISNRVGKKVVRFAHHLAALTVDKYEQVSGSVFRVERQSDLVVVVREKRP
jgi:hypothetical protein